MEREPGAIDPVVREVIGRATAFSAADVFRAQYALKDAQREAEKLWQQVDLLLVPTAPGHPRFAEVAADPVGSNSRLGTYTNFVNLLGWCALAVPAGTASDDSGASLPFGITFIASANYDAALTRLGSRWQHSLELPLGVTGMLPASNAALQVSEVRLKQLAVQASLPIAVVGAHLSGMPLNGQLRERGARLLQSTQTAPHYRLYALPGTTPPKPGLMRVACGGSAIAVEVWDMPADQVGSFLALIPPPLGLGSLELQDGRWVHGFLCEAHALAQAEDISHHGGWRAYIASLTMASTPSTALRPAMNPST
jgi:allophanate hydrolase